MNSRNFMLSFFFFIAVGVLYEANFKDIVENKFERREIDRKLRCFILQNEKNHWLRIVFQSNLSRINIHRMNLLNYVCSIIV